MTWKVCCRVAVLVLVLTGCNQETQRQEPPVTDQASLQFSGARAFAAVETQVAFGPRPTGSAANADMRDWIVATLNGLDWQVVRQSFAPISGVTAENIIAVRGDGPTVALGAHHDTRLHSDEDQDPANHDRPGPGANDGGSGVAVLLELARVLASQELDGRICLMFFDAEDNGDIGDWEWAMGSAWYVANPGAVPECDDLDAMVVVDMVGDRDLGIYRDFGSTTALQDEVWAVAAQQETTGFVDQRRYSIIDDHVAFRDAGIPALVVIDFEYPHWHTMQDTADKVSAESLQSVGRVMEAWVRDFTSK